MIKIQNIEQPTKRKHNTHRMIKTKNTKKLNNINISRFTWTNVTITINFQNVIVAHPRLY